jgi:hypothetical protein
MPFSIECAGFASPDSMQVAPYATSLVEVDAASGLTIAWTDLGDGAAQMVPRAISRPLLRACVPTETTSPAVERLRAMMDRFDEALALLGDSVIYRGASAEVIATLASDTEVFIATSGYARAYIDVYGGGLFPVTIDETSALHEYVRDPAFVSDVVFSGMRGPTPGARKRLRALEIGHPSGRAWQTVKSALGTSVFCCTSHVHHAIPDTLLTAWASEALLAADLQDGAEQLWNRGYEWVASQPKTRKSERLGPERYALKGAITLFRSKAIERVDTRRLPRGQHSNEKG